MNWTDYVIIVVLALSVLVGLWRGLISEVLALAIWVVAAWLAWMFGPKVAAAFAHTIDDPSIRIILGYALCFVVVLIAGALVRFLVDKLVTATGLKGSDRMLGMVFGLVRGALLVTLVVFVLGFTPFPRDAWWHESRLLPTFTRAADWLGQQLPDSMQRQLHPPDRTHPHIPLAQKVAGTATRASHFLQEHPESASSTTGVADARVAPANHSRDN